MSGVISRLSRRLFQLQGDIIPISRRILFKRSFASVSPDKNDEGKSEVDSAAELKGDSVKTEENEELLKLNDALKDMKDKYQRSLAENENVRKRLRKEISDSKLFAVQGFCKDLLTVADILSTAVDTVPKDISTSTENDKMWNDFYDGVKMTKQELLSVFKRHGLVQFTPEKGDKFDPNIHEAMFQAPVPDLQPGLIAHVQTSGYLLHDRTLRPAQVGVSK